MNRSSAACVRAAGRVGVVGSLPLSRCATAPPRGEHSDRAVREGTAGWRTSARGLAVAASIGRSPPLARLGASPSVAARQLPLGGSDWIGLFGRGLSGWQALAPGSARSVRRWLPRVGAAAGGEWRPCRPISRIGAVGSLPLSRCATAPPRGERLDRSCSGGDSRLAGFGSWIGALRSAVAPASGSCRRRRWRPCGGSSDWRGWEPPPQSLRDSSPSGGAIGSGCLGWDCRLADLRLADWRAPFGGGCLGSSRAAGPL